MYQANFGDIHLAWEAGPGLAHAAGHFKNTDRGPKTVFCRRLVDISEQIRTGQLDEEEGIRRVLGAAAAFLTVKDKEPSGAVILVTATEVIDGDQTAEG